ncbi:MAG: ribulose-phosphate 3-epimerase [Eubacteriales bacterium]|nr:ribulose-phosphate 3-epimerase [Eubacteriales bacterium]
MNYYLSPSILSADFAHLGEDIGKAQAAGTQYLHYDVMDGLFVPSISFGMPVLESVRRITDLVLDVHLMIVDPDRYIDDFVKCGADIITVHQEACKDVRRTLEMIRERGVKAGVTIKPGTPLTALEDVLPLADMILLMTVEPGFGGQAYIPESTQKIRDLRQMLDERGLSTDVEVDGGIKKDNLEMVLDAGANVIVAGSAIFKGDIEQNTKDFIEILGKRQ